MRRTVCACLFAFIFAAMTPAIAKDAELAARGLHFAEGTIFVGDTLYLVDYSTSDVLKLDGRRLQKVWHQDGCGANGLLRVPDGLLVACYDGNTIAKVSLDGKLLGTIHEDAAKHPLSRPNDFAVDGAGRIYVTTSGSGGADLGKVLRLDADGQARELASGIDFANGIAISGDGKDLYVVESKADRVLAFKISNDGSLTDRRDLIRFDDVLPGHRTKRIDPDSMRIDRHGNLFVALYNGPGIAVVNSKGQLVALIPVPGPHHTNLAISPGGRFLYATAIFDMPGGDYRGEVYRIGNPTIN